MNNGIRPFLCCQYTHPFARLEMTGFEPVTSGLQNRRSPTELHPRRMSSSELRVLGFEPRTSALSELRSSQLSYTRLSLGKQKSQTHIGLALSARQGWIERHLISRE